ncbi:hypothetical protein C8R44DRAFT_749544 [Mycena epipterygia]|nr:hypothetical protein C8R44DRAFT_749544 [Mycena epipterygia]
MGLDLLSRSKCAFQRLYLINFTLDEDVLAILSSSTSLRTLIIRSEGWDAANEKTAKLLVKKLAEPSFLPCLEDLDITIFESPDNSLESASEPMPCKIRFINGTFVKMLAAKWKRRGTAVDGAHLKKVPVRVEIPSTVALSKTRGVGGLRKMCDEGLDVVLRVQAIGQSKVVSYVYDV